MLTKRIIPCLDVKNGRVVKGVQFINHRIVGDIVTLASYYRDQGADELVFYDISASSEDRTVNTKWITKVSRCLDIPFCVAGGIRSVEDARRILDCGAEKISINSPALESPILIASLAEAFGSQSVVVGIDSYEEDGEYYIYQYTGDVMKMRKTERKLFDWLQQIQLLGAGEIVLNCMNQDGMRNGYDLDLISKVKRKCRLPLIASGGAGCMQDFKDLFQKTNVDGALAASIFHDANITIPELKKYLFTENVEVRL